MNAPLNPISTFAPGATAGEKAQKLRLYKARNIAGARAARSHGWTHHVFRTAEEIAAEWLWSKAGEDELRTVADALVRMFQAGREIERVEADHA